METRYDFGGGSFLLANYTFADSSDENGRRSTDVPRHRGNITANWAIKKNVNLKKFEKKLGHKIQLFVESDINKLHSNLFNNVVNGIKLFGSFKIK